MDRIRLIVKLVVAITTNVLIACGHPGVASVVFAVYRVSAIIPAFTQFVTVLKKEHKKATTARQLDALFKEVA